MILPKINPLAKLTKVQQARRDRLRREFKKKASTQNSIYFTSQFESGIMHVEGNRWSQTYRLGDTAYTTAPLDDKLNVVDSYGEALNSLDAGDSFQLLVINRRVDNDTVKQVLYDFEGNQFDSYRKEYNTMIKDRFSLDAKNFRVDKYVTLSTEAYEKNLADNQLREMGLLVENAFGDMEISFDQLKGLERLEIFNYLLRHSPYLPYTYKDIELSGLRAKDFIAPNRLHFMENQFRIDEKFAKVLYIRQYPSFLSDRLIKGLCEIGIELAISIHAEALEPGEVAIEIANQEMAAKTELVKNQREGFRNGIDGELAMSGKAKETSETTKQWREQTTEGGQKVFKGVMTVFFTADSQEELNLYSDKVKSAARKEGVIFDECYYHQEEALNTILPIGRAYLDVKRDYIRPYTTANLATQIPFTNVDLQSTSPRALYYGQNQLTNNLITLDRKRDLNAANGLIMGASGSGKGMTTKTEEIIPTLLKYPEDRFIIVDPEDEYSDIAKEFGGQVINLSTKSKSHLNLLDLPETERVLYNDNDEVIEPISDKANLLMTLFESILKEVTDDHITIIDRVTNLTYERYEKPTLKEWQTVLEKQPEAAAKELATRAEIYTQGSLDLFANETNVNLDSRLVVFNLKGLHNKLKVFALLVLQDYIWQQVVKYQGKETIRLYWDELHMTFRNESDARFFAELWARIRKYGAIVTGITQDPVTIVKMDEGRSLMSNTKFFILLGLNDDSISALRNIVRIPEAMYKYIIKPKTKGSGLIIAGNTIVPFENPIPKDTQLYTLTNTDS